MKHMHNIVYKYALDQPTYGSHVRQVVKGLEPRLKAILYTITKIEGLGIRNFGISIEGVYVLDKYEDKVRNLNDFDVEYEESMQGFIKVKPKPHLSLEEFLPSPSALLLLGIVDRDISAEILAPILSQPRLLNLLDDFDQYVFNTMYDTLSWHVFFELGSRSDIDQILRTGLAILARAGLYGLEIKQVMHKWHNDKFYLCITL